MDHLCNTPHVAKFLKENDSDWISTQRIKRQGVPPLSIVEKKLKKKKKTQDRHCGISSGSEV